jgi:hypothetical protein
MTTQPMTAVDDIEVRTFYIRDCHDRWGARVWASVTAGPCRATNDETQWTVYHRPDEGDMYPVKLVHATNMADAIETARKLADAYRAIDAMTAARGVGRGRT